MTSIVSRIVTVVYKNIVHYRTDSTKMKNYVGLIFRGLVQKSLFGFKFSC